MPEARVPGIWLLGAVLAGMLLSAPIGALPGAAEAPVKSAAAALARGDGIAAEAELNRALAAGAGKPDVAAAMGEALLDQGKPVRAREWLGPAQFARGSEAYGWRMLGLLERQEGHLAAAGRAYDKALALTPKDPQQQLVGKPHQRGELIALQRRSGAPSGKIGVAGQHQRFV